MFAFEIFFLYRIKMEKYLKGKKSVIWNFFTPQNEIKATCNFCKQALSYKSSISNLKQHIQRKHPSIKMDQNQQTCTTASLEKDSIPIPSTSRLHTPVNLDHIPDASNAISLSSNNFSHVKIKEKLHQTILRIPTKIGFPQKNNIEEKLLNLVTRDFQPLSIVEDIGFRNYSHALNHLIKRHQLLDPLEPKDPAQ